MTDTAGGVTVVQTPVTVGPVVGTCPPGFRDDFNGSDLAAGWNVVRRDQTLAVADGKVTIPTQAGDLYTTSNTAKNVVLRPAPTGPFVITAKVNHKGLVQYQQAGVIVYGTDDNYVKLDRTASNAPTAANTEFFEFIQEQNGTARNAGADRTSNLAATFPQDFYLRISYDGTNLTGSYSTDGTTFTNAGRASTPLPANAQVGFFALSNAAATQVNATFDWFEMTGPNVPPDPTCVPGDGANADPAITSATASKTFGIAPLAVDFTAAATDPNNDTLTYLWDFDNDGSIDARGANVSGNLTKAGTDDVRLTVVDGKGGVATRTVPVTVLAADDPSKRLRALVFSKTAGFRHDSIGTGVTALRQLGTDKNWQVDATEDAGWFTDDILGHYDTVIFLSTTGDVLNDTQQAAFERFIRAGGGYAGIHSAADTEYGWPWYGKLVGAYFRNHPNGTPTATTVVEDTTDPSTAGIPARWTRADEWYNFQSPENPVVNGGGNDYSPRNTAGVHVLLTMDESTYAEADGTDTVDDDHPIAWCQRYDGGRSWYTGLAHTQASFSDPTMLGHLAAGIEITAGATNSAACGKTAAPVNHNPTVTVSRTPTGAVNTGTAVNFTAAGADEDGDTLTYAWDFGDGGTSTQQNPAHTYTTGGTFEAKVTVSDGKGGTAMATASVIVNAPPQCGPGTGFLEDFNGTALGAGWEVVRGDSALTVGGGLLTIPTQAGDLYQTTNTAKNIVLRPAPTGPFTITAKVNHKGLVQYQQAGIIVYGDDNNYVKLDRTASNAPTAANVEFFEFIQEQNATARNATQDRTANLAATFPQDFYVRISYDGTNLTGSYSTDGTTFTAAGRASTPLPANAKIGLHAFSNAAATQVLATFDWFKVDGPNVGTPCPNADPVIASATRTPAGDVEVGTPVAFTAAATDADGDTLAYAWEFGDGGTATGATASGPTPPRAPTAPR